MTDSDRPASAERKIRVLAVDDHELIRGGMAFLLSPFEDIELIGAAGSGEAALQLCQQLRPDVVLMDLRLPGMDGAEATQAILAACPWVKILALTSFYDQELVGRMLRAGAMGYLLKGVSMDDLAGAIRSVHAGKPALAVEAMQALVQGVQPQPGPGEELSPRELEVLRLLAGGKSNREISMALSISLPTVKSHVSNILAKLGAANRGEAVSKAARYNLL